MKNRLALLALAITLFACSNNNHSGTGKQTHDSILQLLQSFQDSIRKYPNDTLLKYEFVLALQEAGRYKEAISFIDSINIGKGDSANLKTYYNYLYKRAELSAQDGDTAKAIATLELFVIPGELTEAGKQLANLYAETRNPKTIVVCDLMNKNDISNRDPDPDYLKGIYYYNINDYNKAIEQFNSCIKKDYTFLDAYMEKGRILFKQTKYQEAIGVYDLTIKISNTFADAHFWKGKCQEALGQKAEAKISYQRAYAFDKTFTEAKEAADRIKD